MNQYQNFTSLSQEEEQTFVVYEQRTQETSKKALVAGVISGAAFFVLVFMTVCVAYPNAGKNLMAGEDMGMLADEKERAQTRDKMEAPTPAAPEGEAKPDEAAAPDGEAKPDDTKEGGAPPSDDESE